MRVKYLVYSPNFVEKIVKGKKKKKKTDGYVILKKV